MKDSSTIHALVELIDLCKEALDNPGKVLRVLLLDYSKVFDCVDHSLLLTKLANMGVHDCLVKWFTSFLCDRKQRTEIIDDISEWCTINAGVPRGTLFGPVEFIVHINDLRTRLPLYKYVDDIKSHRKSHIDQATGYDYNLWLGAGSIHNDDTWQGITKTFCIFCSGQVWQAFIL